MALRIKSAKKKHRQSLKRKVRNNLVKSSLRTKTKKFLATVDSNNESEARAMLPEVVSAFDKAVSKGVIHRKNASRNIGKISRKVSRIPQQPVSGDKAQETAASAQTN